MALGIDSVAHEFSKGEEGKTIAVVGCGLNHIYPEENKELFFSILKSDGCIVSEYEPDSEIDMKNFPKRNRIISGISDGVLVVEASYKSGSSITGRLAEYENWNINCEIEKEPNISMKKEAKKHVPNEYMHIYQLISYTPQNIQYFAVKSGMKIAEVTQKLIMLELQGYIKSMPRKLLCKSLNNV